MTRNTFAWLQDQVEGMADLVQMTTDNIFFDWCIRVENVNTPEAQIVEMAEQLYRYGVSLTSDQITSFISRLRSRLSRQPPNDNPNLYN